MSQFKEQQQASEEKQQSRAHKKVPYIKCKKHSSGAINGQG